MRDTQLIATVHQQLRTGQVPTIAQTYALLSIIDDLETLYVRAAQTNDAVYAVIATCGLQVVCVREGGSPLAWAYQWDGDSPCGHFTTPSAALGAGLAAWASHVVH
jgi:hypothetical protein